MKYSGIVFQGYLVRFQSIELIAGIWQFEGQNAAIADINKYVGDAEPKHMGSPAIAAVLMLGKNLCMWEINLLRIRGAHMILRDLSVIFHECNRKSLDVIKKNVKVEGLNYS